MENLSYRPEKFWEYKVDIMGNNLFTDAIGDLVGPFFTLINDILGSVEQTTDIFVAKPR